jgi:hypothetical protein
VFQIVDRDKPDAKEIILCYTGFGLRITFPRSIPGLMDAIPESLREGLKKLLKENLKLDLPTDILFNVVSGKIPAIESSTPGPFTEFDVKPGRNRPMINLKGFEGPGEVFKGIEIGKVVVGFSSPRTFSRPDPQERPRISCKSGCRDSLVSVIVGTGAGFEVLAPTKGELVDGNCKCVEGAQKLSIRAIRSPQTGAAFRRVLATRRLPPLSGIQARRHIPKMAY